MRPKIMRRIERMPEHSYFKPNGIPKNLLNEVELKIEEMEALRLKDYEGLQQSECAERMNVSRQTFQLIIGEARKKVVSALLNGYAIHITGGNYTFNMCGYYCSNCKEEFEVPYENDSIVCPNCGSEKYQCHRGKGFCDDRCKKR